MASEGDSFYQIVKERGVREAQINTIMLQTETTLVVSPLQINLTSKIKEKCYLHQKSLM
jgi:hypothetical protein